MAEYHSFLGRLKFIKELIENDRLSEARNLALRSYQNSIQNPEYHLSFGKIFEELGFAEKAERCYENTLKLDSNNKKALLSLAKLLYEVGRLDVSMNLFRKVLKLSPNEEEARSYLKKVYKELGFEGSCQIISNKKEKSTLRYFPPSLGKSELEVFENLFITDVDSYFEVKLDNVGKIFLVRIPERPNHNVIRSHILGEKTISCSLLGKDKRVKTGVLEIKIPKKDVISHIRKRCMLEMKEEKLKETAIGVLKKTKDLGFPVYLERTSRYKYRLWFFFEEPVHILFSKRFLRTILEKMPIPEMGIVLEISLPTKDIYIGWKENPTILPLGLSPATKERYLFVSEKGKPYTNQISFIKKIRKISVKMVKEILRGKAPFTVKKEGAKALELLRERCKILDFIIKKAEAGRNLRREEKVVVYFTLGILDLSGDLVHEVLFSCPDYRYEKVKRELKNLRPNPISCLKIRELVPDIASSVDCNCIFDTSDGRYPSPLMHVDRLLVPREEEKLTIKHLGVKGFLKKYLSLVSEMENLRNRIDTMEDELEMLFLKKNWIVCELGEFKIVYNPQGKNKFKVEKT